MKILALDVGGTAIKSAYVDPDGRVEEYRCTPSDMSTLEALTQCAIRVARTYNDYDVLAVSMTGQIDHKTQTVVAWSDGKAIRRICFPVGKILSEALQRPVFVLNDANAAALGEASFGAGRGCPDFLCLTYGTGVGGGIIHNGVLLTGQHGIAGEPGHLVVHAGGRRCRCGHRGCYQEYASTTALLREARKLCPELPDAKALFDRIGEEPGLSKAVEGWIREIVEGLCSLAYLFDPTCFVLGGGVLEREDVARQIRARFQKRIIPSYGDIEIRQAALGNRAGMIGAAVFARREMRNPSVNVGKNREDV